MPLAYMPATHLLIQTHSKASYTELLQNTNLLNTVALSSYLKPQVVVIVSTPKISSFQAKQSSTEKYSKVSHPGGSLKWVKLRQQD